MLSPCHRSCHSFSLSWHLWVGFLCPRFPLRVVLREPVPCRQPTTNMQWQFKSVHFTGSGRDSGHWAPGRKDAYATRQAELWQIKREWDKTVQSIKQFYEFHQVYGPVLAQHFCSERLELEQRQVHLQVRESACRLSSLIHRHQLQQRICLEYCYASRKGAVPLWSRHRTEAGMLRSSVLFEPEAAVCCPIREFAHRTVYCTCRGLWAATLHRHERDGLTDTWR